MLNGLDDDENGSVSYDELVQGLHDNTQLKMLIQLLDITPDDLLGLFKLLDVKDEGVLSVESFVLALLKCHAMPQGVDMVRIMSMLNSIRDEIHHKNVDQYRAEARKK